MGIFARILSPNDFSLMGIALLAMATLETFTQTGFQQALIQKKADIRPYLDSAWTVLILRGFVLFAILYSSDLGKAKGLLGFGKWILGPSILLYLLV